MKNTAFWGAILSGALAATPVIAEDSTATYHALSQLPSGFTAMPEAQLASIEGGQNTQNCGSGASGLVAVNLLNCSNVAVVLVVPICVGAGALLGTGSAACQQATTVGVSQVVQDLSL